MATAALEGFRYDLPPGRLVFARPEAKAYLGLDYDAQGFDLTGKRVWTGPMDLRKFHDDGSGSQNRYNFDATPKRRTAGTGAAWDFSLPTLDGSAFVQLASHTGPVLVNFWGKDCVPCIAELPRLHAFAKAHRDWTVLLVSTDAPTDAREFVRRHAVQLTVLRQGGNVAALMRTAGNRSGGLPFTVAVRADGREARICGRQLGELNPADLDRLAAVCRVQAGS